MENFAIAIHGGAGTILKSAMTPEKESAYRNILEASLKGGEKILKEGGSAIDAVQESVRIMEDSPLFNAGKGSVFTHEKDHELDASIMEGKERRAGAVAGVKQIKNPILLCREILEKSEHVFLLGKGAEEFATSHGMELVDKSYFHTDFREKQLMEIIDTGKTQLDHSDKAVKKYGTVGAVALDSEGNLASATSTGGITNKRYGRVGDTAIIGSGTYAENGVCAVSGTGWGEYFIRTVAAYEIAALMKYGKLSLREACDTFVHQTIPKIGGDGGVIAIDSQGNICMPFNTEGMYRGMANSKGERRIEIYS